MSTQYILPTAPVMPPPMLDIVLPLKFEGLFKPKRYKVRWGGRGGAKSWSVAEALVIRAHTSKLLILCARELQNSIADSVHRLLVDQIDRMGLTSWFHVTQKTIVSLATGSEFIFKGLRHNSAEIKSTEGIDIVWIEEAQLVSAESWELLIPTIRKANSELWITFNAVEETDATYQRFVPRCLTCAKVFSNSAEAEQHAKAVKPAEHDVYVPPNCDVELVNWSDNPHFPQVLEDERLYMLKTDPAAYEHVWQGGCRLISEAVIFKGKYIVEPFETPVDPPPRFFHGNDFGFADDPLALIRCFITENRDSKKKLLSEDLWIDQEVYGHGLDLDVLKAKYESEMPSSRQWPIKADNSRPETISYLKRRGFAISAADKWAGSIEDGISHLRAFRMIHIHPRCAHMAIEARLYSWKVDKKQLDAKGKPVILPVPVDRHNHCWDAIRYALDGYIQRRGQSEVWKNL